ncbi:probable caffeine synthase 4 [Pistacia vera]|uniref:probable caffeine synthase 4 n=1 Tax=Pistacia vera TaxID=55513 RepID=UPI001262CD37|nr:probable caffeine synthase 4 [Pistacia vera]
MGLKQVLHMNGGEEDFSYANNSSTQNDVILKAKPLIQESIYEMCSNNVFSECFRFADLGCSSGPNTYLPTWEVIEALDLTCRGFNHKPPMLQVFLNDLPGNDFNSAFKSLPSFYERLEKEKGDEFGQHNCLIAAVPRSFYERLFPPHSLHFIFSSYAVHWLSQVPEGLVSESGIPMNKQNFYIGKTSPSNVRKAYLDQFEKDFTLFLKLRSEELKSGGRMVLTVMGDDKHNPHVWDLLGDVANDMVSEGLIEGSKLESFNVPLYSPRAEEVRHIIEREGSFNIHQLQTFNISWFQISDMKNHEGLELDSSMYSEVGGKTVAGRKRAVAEPLVARHFGKAIMDDMFQRFSIKATHYLEMEPRAAYPSILFSLIKK